MQTLSAHSEPMKYLPIISEADEEMQLIAEEDTSSRNGERDDHLSRVLVMLGFSSVGAEPAEWRAQVDASPIYMLSCFAYCAAGGVTVLKPEPLERHMLFPWRFMGLMIFANGFFSYMSDVETWGRPSIWKPMDRLLATLNCLIQVAIVAIAASGKATFPWQSPAILGTGVVLALMCKQRAAASFRRRDCGAYLFWHAAWHYTLPLFAIAGQCILHTRCDYFMTSSCGCMMAKEDLRIG